MVKYSKQVKSTSIALLIFSLLTISIDSILLTTQILNDLLPTFGIGILLGLFGILAGSYGICAAKATKAEHFFGKYTTSGCWSVFGGIFAFFGLAWLSFAFSCHAICINEYSSDEPSAFYMKLTGHNFTDDGWKPMKPADIGWLVNGTCINFQKDWTVDTPDDLENDDNSTDNSNETTESLETLSTADSTFEARTLLDSASEEIIEESTTISSTTSGTTTTTSDDNSNDEDDHYTKKSIVIAYMSLYLSELVLVFILFIIFIVLSNATGCCYCESNSVDIEADEEESYKNDSSSDEDSSDSSSDDSSDEE